jgi:hypothetical protein
VPGLSRAGATRDEAQSQDIPSSISCDTGAGRKPVMIREWMLLRGVEIVKRDVPNICRIEGLQEPDLEGLLSAAQPFGRSPKNARVWTLRDCFTRLRRLADRSNTLTPWLGIVLPNQENHFAVRRSHSPR